MEVPSHDGLLPGIPGKRCAHCNTQTTPLWRNGPDGPKTLCNACGVRDNRRHAKVRPPPRNPENNPSRLPDDAWGHFFFSGTLVDGGVAPTDPRAPSPHLAPQQNRNANARPRPRKPQARENKPKVAADGTPLVGGNRPKRVASAPMFLGSEELEAGGGRRSARWNAGLLTKRAKLEAQQHAAQKAARRANAMEMDLDADGNIRLPSFTTVADYDESSMSGFAPPAGYIRARPHTLAGRFEPNGPAPMYTATSEDRAWLAAVNRDRAADAERVRERELETLFDVFEEASWHAGAMVPSAPAAYDILGYGETSVAEAEAAVKSARSMPEFDLSWAEAEGDLLSPAAGRAPAWDVSHDAFGAIAKGGRSNDDDDAVDPAPRRDVVDSPPVTPTGSVEPGDYAGVGAPRSDQDPSETNAGLSPGSARSAGSASVDADGTDADTDGDTDAEIDAAGAAVDDDESADGLGNGKSSDLVTRGGKVRATRSRALKAKATRATTTATKKSSKKVVNTSLKKVNRGASELRKKGPINRAAEKNNTKLGGDKNSKHNNKQTTIKTTTTTSKVAKQRAGAPAPKRIPNGPTFDDADLVYAYYRELRLRNGGRALLPRFECPAPPSYRARAQLGGNKEVCDDNGQDDDRATKTIFEPDQYQFVLGYEGVRRQQRERAARCEAIAAAARRRRRRACFNPAASKRRRKQQAAMEVAIEAPLTVVHEPLFAEPDPEPDRDGDSNAGHDPSDPSDAFDADVFKIDRSECVESEWESDDDVPLATLHGDGREPTLAELLARTKRDADTQLKKASIALERPCPTVSSPGIPDSVMNRLSKAANEVMSRIVGLKPTPMQPFTHGLSTPDTTPRKPRKVHRFKPVELDSLKEGASVKVEA